MATATSNVDREAKLNAYYGDFTTDRRRKP